MSARCSGGKQLWYTVLRKDVEDFGWDPLYLSSYHPLRSLKRAAARFPHVPWLVWQRPHAAGPAVRQRGSGPLTWQLLRPPEFSVSLRPIIASTEAKAWEKAWDYLDLILRNQAVQTASAAD